MTQKQTIVTILTTIKASNAQLADHLMTTPNTIQVAISELRKDGHRITPERAEGTNGHRYRLEEGEDG